MSKSSARHKNLGKDPKQIAAKIAAKHARNKARNDAAMQANLDYISAHGLERQLEERVVVQVQRDGSRRSKIVTVLEAPSTTVRRHQREIQREAAAQKMQEIAQGGKHE